MNFRTQSALFCVLFGVVFCLTVWFRKERSRTTLPFFLFNLALVAMALFVVLSRATGGPVLMLLSWGAGLFVAPCLVYLVYTFVYHEERALEILVVLMFLGSAFISAAMLTPKLPFMRSLFENAAQDKLVYLRLGVVLVSGLLPIGLLAVRAAFEPSGLLRRRYLIISIVGFFALVGTSTDTLGRLGVRTPPMMFITLVLLDYYLHQTVVRFRHLTFRIIVGNAAVFFLAAFFLTAIYAPLIYWIKPIPALFLVHTLAAGFLLIILYEPVFTRVETGIARLLFRDRFAIREHLDALISGLARAINLEEVYSILNKDGRIAMGGISSAVYLLEGEGKFSSAALSDDSFPQKFSDISLEKILQKETGVLPLVKLESAIVGSYPGPERNLLDSVRQVFTSLNFHLIVPIKIRDHLMGFWGLRLGQPLDPEELNLLKQVADQVALKIDNAKIYEKFRAADRLATVGELAAALAHEIRNPLGAVKGAAQFLSDEELPSKASEFVQIIVDEVNRLDSVLARFLDFARPFAVHKTRVDWDELIARSASALFSGERNNHAAELVVKPNEKKFIVHADQELVRQVIINLVKNAIEAGDGSGIVEVSTGCGQDFVWAEVSDRGKGISPDQLPRLFVPFYTTKKKGSGLGLAISQRIAEAHGGRIEPRAREGGGAIFTLYLPLEHEGEDS